MKKILLLTISFILLNTFSSCSKDSQPLFIGILETHNTDWPCKLPSNSNEFYSFIRITFLFESKKWTPIHVVKKDKTIFKMENKDFKPINKSYYNKLFTEYHMLYDIKNIGSVTAIESNEFIDYSAFSSVISIKEKKIIHIGKISDDFSDDYCGDTSYRPIIVSNIPNYQDPMEWKPFNKKINPELINKLSIEFTKNLEEELNEAYDKEPMPSGKVIYIRSFSSNKDDLLIKLSLKTTNELMYNGNLLTKWFYVSNDEIKYLGSYKNLIDAADYDKDGFSDLIFFETGGYNSSGYTLIYNNLANKCQFYYELN